MSGESGAGKTESTKLLLQSISCVLMAEQQMLHPPAQAEGSDFLRCVCPIVHAGSASVYQPFQWTAIWFQCQGLTVPSY